MEGWKEEYYNEVDNLSALVAGIRASAANTVTKLEPKALKIKLDEGDANVQRIKEVKKSFGLELRLIKDRTIKSKFEADAKLLDTRVVNLVKDLRSLRDGMNRSELGERDGGANGGKGLISRDTKGKGNDDLLEGAHLLQDKTMESLGRTTAMIEESKELGTASIQNLKDQREQIEGIGMEITNIDSKLKRAEKLIKNFTRRMASDKFIRIFAGINILVMGTLIIYVLVTGKSLGTVSEEAIAAATATPVPTAEPAAAP